MFEKEAEEYADKDFGMYTPTDHERYAKETDWRNGAEFGYNKAKEEMQAQIEKMKCCENCEHNFDVDGTRSNHCVKCKNFSNWELEE